VSLTIADIKNCRLTVALIPVTLEHTNLGRTVMGDSLNLEVDIMGKYMEKLIEPYLSSKKEISEELLVNLGYHA
jgi:riboflavin synthase